MRFTLAVILMLSVGLIFRGNTIVGLQRVDKQDIPLFLLGGLLQPFLYFIFETYTYQSFASPTIAEAMLSTQPIMAPIMAWLLLREQVTKYNIIGILISTAGMLLLLLTGGEQFAIGNHLGILLAIITVSCSVGYSVILRRIPERYSPLTIVFYVQTISLVLFYILWGGDMLLNTTQSSSILLNTTQSSSTLLPSILAVLYLAILASVTAFILFCYTVRYIGVTRANIFNNIRPVFTALLMLAFFHEHLPIMKWIGIVVIIIGLFICQKQRKI